VPELVLSWQASSRLWLRVSCLLELHNPTLKLGDQLIALIYLPNHLTYPGVSVGELAL
jgi:hypothetical protein